MVLKGDRKVEAFFWVEGWRWGECTRTVRDCRCINGEWHHQGCLLGGFRGQRSRCNGRQVSRLCTEGLFGNLLVFRGEMCGAVTT
jgi:hypothetical protein